MKIGCVSEKNGLGIHTIRYYEKQGLLRKPEKDNSGHRAYDAKDVDILNWIVCMKNSGMSLSRIKAYTKAFYDDDHAVCVAYLEDHLKHLPVAAWQSTRSGYLKRNQGIRSTTRNDNNESCHRQYR